MTSNQLGYMANAENIRHNQVTETETKRHNEVMEKLENDANSIQAEKNVITATYQQNMADIQREYNATYLAIQKAQGDRKLDLQAQLNLIEKKKADAQEAFQIRSNDIRLQEASNQRASYDEIKRHNVNMESFDRQRLEEGSWAEKKLAEFNLARLGAESGYWSGLLANQSVRNTNDWLLGTEANRLKDVANDIQFTSVAGDIFYKTANARQNKTNAWLNFASTLGGAAINAAGRVGSRMVGGK